MSVSAVHASAPITATRINWGPYLAGTGIGVLSWIVFAVVNDPGRPAISRKRNE